MKTIFDIAEVYQDKTGIKKLRGFKIVMEKRLGNSDKFRNDFLKGLNGLIKGENTNVKYS